MIECTALSKVFGGQEREVLDLARQGVSRAEIQRRTGSTLAVCDVSFDVGTGELFVVMGLSGSGKSTLVRLLNRLIEPTAGEITVAGQAVASLRPAELRALRNAKLAMVFQQFALFPHRTVAENAAYGLHVRDVGKDERRERAIWALQQVGLADRADAYPGQLSGGMKQRVGLARALATDSEVLLMDEPFSALDPLIRRDMQDLLLHLQKELAKTIVFITHDLNEAMRLGNRILLLKDGRLVQLGTGPEILAAPADEYVADFVSDVDRARVLTASDVARDALMLARVEDAPQDVLRRLGTVEATGMYVVDSDRRIVGVATDEHLAGAIGRGARTVAEAGVGQDYLTTPPGRPLIDLVRLVGRHPVPLAVVDDAGRLLGVVPRAALLEALATPDRRS